MSAVQVYDMPTSVRFYGDTLVLPLGVAPIATAAEPRSSDSHVRQTVGEDLEGTVVADPHGGAGAQQDFGATGGGIQEAAFLQIDDVTTVRLDRLAVQIGSTLV